MRNYIQDGCVMNYSNSSGSTIASGDVVKVGNLIGVAGKDIADGDSGPVNLEGVFSLTKVGSQAWAQGDKVFWDHTNLRFTKTASTDADVPAGIAFEAVGSGAGETLGLVKLQNEGAHGIATAVATIATADGSDPASTQALANALKTALNSVIANLKAAGIMDN